MNRFFTYVSVIMMSFVVLAGCQSLTGKTAGTNIDDTVITSSVNAKLAGDSVLSLTRIDVDTERGIVTLNGVVKSEAAKNQAAQLAGQVDGVTKVNNNLQIQAN